MNDAYRDPVARCPACKSEMELRKIDDADIDVCTACRGLWLDWFDGDTAVVTAMAMPLSTRAPVPMAADAPCPRCAIVLEEHRHESIGPILYRCAECAGTFIPRALVEALLEFVPPPSRVPQSPEEASALDRLIAAVRRVFGTDAR